MRLMVAFFVAGGRESADEPEGFAHRPPARSAQCRQTDDPRATACFACARPGVARPAAGQRPCPCRSCPPVDGGRAGSVAHGYCSLHGDRARPSDDHAATALGLMPDDDPPGFGRKRRFEARSVTGASLHHRRAPADRRHVRCGEAGAQIRYRTAYAGLPVVANVDGSFTIVDTTRAWSGSSISSARVVPRARARHNACHRARFARHRSRGQASSNRRRPDAKPDRGPAHRRAPASDHWKRLLRRRAARARVALDASRVRRRAEPAPARRPGLARGHARFVVAPSATAASPARPGKGPRR